ncbi:MAG: monovalent cation/H+ antiporter complex subunit F [Campylobacterales bacterium]
MSLYVVLGIILVFNLIVTSVFILKTKSKSSKMLITLLFSTTGVGVLFMLYMQTKSSSILDVALIFVLLSSVAAIVFAKRLRYRSEDDT